MQFALEVSIGAGATRSALADVRALPTPDEQAPRIVVDSDGVEWEVYDEGTWSLEMMLDWDHLPQLADPGLIFSSAVDRRRLWPCPTDWRRLSDRDLMALAGRARSML